MIATEENVANLPSNGSYDFFRVWNAKLFTWVSKEIISSKPDVIKEIIKLCNRDMPQILTLVGEGAFEKNKEVEFRGNHIRYPKLYFKLNSSLPNDMAECRIRINACREDQQNEKHHSKIWISIGNSRSLTSESPHIFEYYKNLTELIDKISTEVKKCYLIPVTGETQDSYYDVFITTFSLTNNKLSNETKNILFSDSGNVRREEYIANFMDIQEVIGDMLSLVYKQKIDEPIHFFAENYDQIQWRLVTSRLTDANLVYAAKTNEMATHIAGVAGIGEENDKMEELRRLFLPTALRLTAYM